MTGARGSNWKLLPVASSILVLCLQLCLLLLPPQPCSASGDGFCGEARAGAATDWYFAEGYTGPGFQEWLCVFNPEEAWSSLDLKVLYNDGPPRTVSFSLAPRSRTTLNVNQVAGEGREVSLHLHCGLPVVAERPMYFSYRGRWTGCTVGGGTEYLGASWFFAEGCTRPGFEEWVLLANPGETEIPASLFFALEDGRVVTCPVTLPPGARRTVLVNAVTGSGHDVATRVEAGGPICCERVMYFNYHDAWPGGHAAGGLAQPRRDFLFAEGYTGPGFEEWLSLYLPGDGDPDGTDATVSCLFEGGEERSFRFHLEPHRRHTISINALVGSGRNVSLAVSAPDPFLAERPMYFDYRGICRGGHVSLGVESAGTRWLLAEGTTRPGFHEYLCLLNPGYVQAPVEVDYILGWDETIAKQYVVPARSRFTIDVFREVPRGRDVSIEVRSPLPVVAERPLYFPGAGFEAANAMRHIRDLSIGIGPRVEGTAGEATAAAYIASVLQGYGYQPAVQEVPLPNGAVSRNVVATLEAAVPGPSTPILVIGAHYDTKGGTGSPGANDNASGTAVVLELARCLAEEGGLPGLQVTFVLFGGEERLVDGTDLHHFGSRYYVANLSPESRARLRGAVIVDMVGVGSQLYARTMGIGPMDLCNSLLSYAARTGIRLPYLKSGSYSDHEPFETAGLPAVWLEVKDDPWYHTPRDSYDKIDAGHVGLTGRLIQGFVLSLAGAR
ncbi:MAG: M28 family peptidase [Actinobacteria bacterium]|nr:M28 family peptidase [Actinomycetota bacterium]